MAIRTTVGIPEDLHDLLRHRSEQSGSSIRSLILRALEQTYQSPNWGRYVRGPLVTGSGKLGPAFPKNENPHDVVFS
jgi:hypothetical protein